MRDRGQAVEQAPEQLVYARTLERGTRIGLAALVVSFALYMMGWIEPRVPVEQMPALWSLPVETFLYTIGSSNGWSWTRLIHRSDVANMIGIVILGGVSIVCVAQLVPLYRRRGDRALAALCVAELIVLLVAASGLLGVAV